MHKKLFFLTLLFGVLLSCAWPTWGFAALAFTGFVPLLLLEELYYKGLSKKYFFLHLYLAFFLWNLLTTWWVYNASAGGAAMAILANSLLMTFVFLFYHKAKNILPTKCHGITFISFWISFEYLHLHWDITWPWLTLGHVFASTYQWIQWYEYTGVFGGSLWVLVVNYLVFKVIRDGFTFKKILFPVIVILSPILISYAIYFGYKSSDNEISVVVVQPNIDPYGEKFSGNYEDQLQRMLSLAKTKLDSATNYLVFPETALTEEVWEEEIENTYSIKALRTFLNSYPNLTIVIGASSSKLYKPGEPTSATARKFMNADEYYDSYNSALQLEKDKPVLVYHKSKLVPGVEKMPWPMLLKPLEEMAINMGGTSGSLGTQDERTVFFSKNNIGIAPVICYESIYGNYVSDYVRNGAQTIFIITNDGWWDDTPGYKQHLAYGRLRAIETRKSIARSANTGISCFINQRGDVEQPQGWWKEAVIKQNIKTSKTNTLYVLLGDYIAIIAVTIMSLLIAYTLGIKIKKEKLRRNT